MEHVITADGSPIAYQRVGNGPPLVMMHGALGSHWAWQPVVPLLSDKFTLYLIDQRGRGESGPYTASYKPEQAYSDIASVINAIGEPSYLLGHSMGARNALHAALLAPNVSKLVLYEPPPFDPFPPARQQQMREALASGDYDTVISIFFLVGPRAEPEELELIKHTPLWRIFTSQAANITTEVISFNDYHFVPDEFRNFNVPTLMLMGSESPAFMKEQTTLINDALPNSRIHLLEGQGHDAYINVPQLFADVVTDFLLSKD